MEHLALIYIVVIASRLYFFFPEKRLSGPAMLVKTAIETAAVILVSLVQTDWSIAMLPLHILALAAFFAALNLWTWIGQARGGNGNGCLSLQFALIALSFYWLDTFLAEQPESLLMVETGLFWLGALVCLNEANVFFRWLMDRLNLKSSNEPSEPMDAAEYNRGRVIGMLERLLIYILAAAGEFTAIGFVLALKAAIRFPALNQRVFAEYVLIGTLLSTLLALGIALIAGGVPFVVKT